MAVELLLPGRRIPAPKPPSRIALSMAFGVGAGAVLGDKSRYRSHGAINVVNWLAGVHGAALDFDPFFPVYVTIPAAHTQLNFMAEHFSMVWRVYIDDLTVARRLFTRGLRDVDGYELTIDATGAIYFTTNQLLANQMSNSAAGDVIINTWHTGGVSRNGASVRLLCDGVDVTLVPGVHIDPLTSARSAKIGIYDDLVSNPMDGRMEFLRIFRGVALSTSEHLAWHNALA